jgi:O-antigen/teichoic acid export membrane protein
MTVSRFEWQLILQPHSIQSRFFFSVMANGLRAAVSMLTGIMIARGLNPHGYGELTYLLGSFVAIRALLDLGTSNAFFTFISRKARDRRFYALYFGWLALQLALSLALVAAIFPQSMLDRIWLGQPRAAIVLALLAAFMQQQVWLTVTQIGEAARLTIRVQSLGFAIALAHFTVVLLLTHWSLLNVQWVLVAIIAEVAVAAVIATRLLRLPMATEPVRQTTVETLRDYWRFCQPLMLVALVAFCYDFADKWLLQKFGGAGQQGYYQIAAQLAAVSLLATTSILSIFWKEVAEANAREDAARLQLLYTRVNRGLLMLGAAVSGLLIPWSEQLVVVLLGERYRDSWPIFALMLLFPIHQSTGQVNATMFMACARTQTYMMVSVAGQLVSLPVTFIMLAPAHGYALPGLALGGFGLALKMVVMNILLTNVQAKLIASLNGWKFQWLWQVAGIGGCLVLGAVAKAVALLAFPAARELQLLPLAAAFSLAVALFTAGVWLFVRSCPWLVGYGREELRALANRFLPARFA